MLLYSTLPDSTFLAKHELLRESGILTCTGIYHRILFAHTNTRYLLQWKYL